jgi:uroporphyrinogen decarboxylase
MLYSRPDLIDHIIAVNAAAVSEYLLEQVKAGAQALMIFDTWGGVLPDGVYQRVSLASMAKVVATLKAAAPDVPVTVFTKGGGIWLQDIAAIGADCVAVDWTVNLGKARALVGHQVALQGNIDPFTLMGRDAHITQQVHATMSAYQSVGGNRQGHVFNLGHGINQFTLPAAVNTMLSAVRSFN